MGQVEHYRGHRREVGSLNLSVSPVLATVAVEEERRTTFQVETWATFYPDSIYLMGKHWAELALDQATIPLDLDVPKYEEMDRSGLLHILTVRYGARLVGYYLAFVFPHYHYASSGLMSFTDIYYLLPEFRKGLTGALLFIEAAKTLKARGVTKAYNSCKIHQDHTELLTRLGWVPTDICFTKIL